MSKGQDRVSKIVKKGRIIGDDVLVFVTDTRTTIKEAMHVPIEEIRMELLQSKVAKEAKKEQAAKDRQRAREAYAMMVNKEQTKARLALAAAAKKKR